MTNKKQTPQQVVANYFDSVESRLGYAFLLKGRKHFGYYPEGHEKLTKLQAQQFMEDKLAERLALPRTSRVLDAGCGEGKVAIYLARNYGFCVTGVDLLGWAVQKARTNALRESAASSTQFHVMDYTALTFPDQSFEGVYTMETLVHVPDCHKALHQLYRVLKPGGTLVLFEYSMAPTTSVPQELKSTWDLVIAGSGMHSLQQFTHGAFPSLLTRAGFVNVGVEDITERIVPMVNKFYSYAYYPYQIICRLGIQQHFVNTVAGYLMKELIAKKVWRYNIVTATKPV